METEVHTSELVEHNIHSFSSTSEEKLTKKISGGLVSSNSNVSCVLDSARWMSISVFL